jgi:acetylornithine/succinyldiaminopimelate/putrescine aminotransferase
MGAFIANQFLMNQLSYSPPLGHITTFGGNPVCCAAALATLEVIEGEELLDTVEEKGRLIESLLKHAHIKEIRRIGLMFAIDFDNEERVNRIVAFAKEKGVICYWFLSHPYSFRIAPPLTITEKEIKEACKIIMEAIDQS